MRGAPSAGRQCELAQATQSIASSSPQPTSPSSLMAWSPPASTTHILLGSLARCRGAAPRRMARFEREAQVLASLNRSTIAAIHGLEESNGVHALVMELAEGETLAERISVAAGFGPAPGHPARRPPDCRRARTCARAWRHSSRPETRESEDHARGHGEVAGLRFGQGTQSPGFTNRTGVGRSAHSQHDVDSTGDDSGHGVVHEPGTGERAASGSPNDFVLSTSLFWGAIRFRTRRRRLGPVLRDRR